MHIDKLREARYELLLFALKKAQEGDVQWAQAFAMLDVACHLDEIESHTETISSRTTLD